MDLTTFQIKIIDFATEEILPSLPAMAINIFGFNVPLSAEFVRFGAGVGTAISTLNLERYAPALKAFGILDENSVIDVEKLSVAMQTEIKKVGKFKIGDFEFDETDVDKFVNYLKI